MKKTMFYGLLASPIIGALGAYASGDYDPAIWRGCCNANWYTSGNGHHFCVIHDMEGYYLSTVSYLTSCSHTTSSVFYAVNGLTDSSDNGAPPGEVTQMVSESYYAWHAICWNTWMYGTEHEGFESNPAWYTDAMYQSSGALQHHLCSRSGIPEDRNHIIAHGEKSNGNWCNWMSANYPSIDHNCNTHTDPGAYWNWSTFMGYVQGDGGGGGGTPTVAGPDACSWGAGRIDVVVRGGGDAIYHKYYVAGQGWLPSGGFERMNGYSTAGPSICSWGANRLDAFCRGTDNSLQHNYWTGSWAGWGPQGGTMASTPDSCSWGANRIDVVTRYSDNNVYHTWWDGSVWHGYENLGGGNCSSAPTICSWASGRLDIFYRGSDNALWHKYYSSGWSGWQSLGGSFQGAPDASCWGSGRIDIVARGTGNDVIHTYYDTSDGKGWTHGWDSLGGSTIGAKCSVAASTANPGRLDVFCIGSDSSLYWKYYDRAGGGWAASWSNVGGQIQ